MILSSIWRHYLHKQVTTIAVELLQSILAVFCIYKSKLVKGKIIHLGDRNKPRGNYLFFASEMQAFRG